MSKKSRNPFKLKHLSRMPVFNLCRTPWALPLALSTCRVSYCIGCTQPRPDQKSRNPFKLKHLSRMPVFNLCQAPWALPLALSTCRVSYHHVEKVVPFRVKSSLTRSVRKNTHFPNRVKSSLNQVTRDMRKNTYILAYLMSSDVAMLPKVPA